MRRRHREDHSRAQGDALLPPVEQARDVTARWRETERGRELRAFVTQVAQQRWTPTLVAALLEELYVDDTITELFGDLRTVPPRRYPQLIAVALALRHSWRPDDFSQFAHRFESPSRRPIVHSDSAVARRKPHK
jgi:hypothetical protein